MNSHAPIHYLNRCNALTYLSLLSGLAAIVAAGGFSSWSATWALLGTSVLLDTFDGRFARRFARTEHQKAFGVQLDSLVDGAVFGVAPPVCLYQFFDLGSSLAANTVWGLASFIFVTASLTRLGCYNVHQATEDHFVGVPTTLAALVLCTATALTRSYAASVGVLLVCALLMVVKVPVPRPRGRGMILFVVWILSVVAFHTLSATLP